MKRILLALTCLCFAAGMARAQSSGSFSYGTGNQFTGTTGCQLLQNGSISGGQQCSKSSLGGTSFVCTTNQDCLSIFGSNSGATCNNPTGGTNTGSCALPADSGTCIGSANAGLKTNSGSGNVFVIRPSAVIGLLTDVTISSKNTDNGIASSSALAGIDVRVSVIPESGQPVPSLTPSGWVTYDARFVQITTNLFQAIAANCVVSPTLPNGCFLTFAESTVSAHSFDWVAGGPTGSKVPLSSGQYGVTLDWRPSTDFGVSGIGQALACVGPVNLTVQQNKIFSFNSVNSL